MAKDDKSMNENKRVRERHTLSLPVMYANLTRPGAVTYSYQQTSTLDISSSGVALVLNEDFNEDDLVQVVVLLPDSPHVVTALAKTVWSNKDEQTNTYHAGMQFVQSSPDLDEILMKQVGLS